MKFVLLHQFLSFWSNKVTWSKESRDLNRNLSSETDRTVFYSILPIFLSFWHRWWFVDINNGPCGKNFQSGHWNKTFAQAMSTHFLCIAESVAWDQNLHGIVEALKRRRLFLWRAMLWSSKSQFFQSQDPSSLSTVPTSPIAVPTAIDEYIKNLGGVDQFDELRTREYGIDDTELRSGLLLLLQSCTNRTNANYYNITSSGGNNINNFSVLKHGAFNEAVVSDWILNLQKRKRRERNKLLLLLLLGVDHRIILPWVVIMLILLAIFCVILIQAVLGSRDPSGEQKMWQRSLYMRRCKLMANQTIFNVLNAPKIMQIFVGCIQNVIQSIISQSLIMKLSFQHHALLSINVKFHFSSLLLSNWSLKLLKG